MGAEAATTDVRVPLPLLMAAVALRLRLPVDVAVAYTVVKAATDNVWAAAPEVAATHAGRAQQIALPPRAREPAEIDLFGCVVARLLSRDAVKRTGTDDAGPG